MRYYLISFSDYSETIGKAKNRNDMLRDANAYCRAWNLSETIRDVREITEEEYNSRKR